jgi:hypothetical protein
MTLVIKKYCSIKEARVSINGRVAMEDETQVDFRKFIRASYRHFQTDYPKFFKMDSLSKLGFLSVDVLLKNENLLIKYPAEKIGIMLFNASSSLEVDEKHWETIRDREQYFPSPSNFVYTLPNIMAGEAAIRHKFKGENTVLISEFFDPELIYNIVSQAFAAGAFDCCICGWVEQYGNNYESLLFLVEEIGNLNEGQKSTEDIIFESSNILKIYKQK